MAKENKKVIWCRMQKGWTAYVRGYKTYTEKYDDIDWSKGTESSKNKKEEVVHRGAKIVRVIKF